MARNLLLSLSLILVSFVLYGQQAAGPVYSGLRLGILDIEVLRQRSDAVNIRCRVANTGRFQVDLANHAPEQRDRIVVEFDSLHLPEILRNKLPEFADALLETPIKLEPGRLTNEPVNLTVLLNAKPETKKIIATDAGSCADLVIDTAYLMQGNELHFTVLNNGNIPVSFTNNGTSFAIACYWVSDREITRGAVPIGSFAIQDQMAGKPWPPGARFSFVMQIDLSRQTRFSHNLALQIDPFLTVQECDRTNNSRTIAGN